MNARILARAIGISTLPAVVGWVLGSLPINHPKVFVTVVIGLLASMAWLAYRQYTKANSKVMGSGASPGSEVWRVIATALVCISFHVSFWTALAYSAGIGLIRPGATVAGASALIAAVALLIDTTKGVGNMRQSARPRWLSGSRRAPGVGEGDLP